MCGLSACSAPSVTATVLPPAPPPTTVPPTVTPNEMTFTIAAGPEDEYREDTLAGGWWEGITTQNATWLRVTFEVNADTHSLSQIGWEIGCVGRNERLIYWEPAKAATTIATDGAFKYADVFNNTFEGRFGSGNYAYGSIAATIFDIQCPDGNFHTPPTQWRAAPRGE